MKIIILKNLLLMNEDKKLKVRTQSTTYNEIKLQSFKQNKLNILWQEDQD